ncbi:MAG: polyprenyl synthetase family protein [Candidatus Omnitrophota bacterium]
MTLEDIVKPVKPELNAVRECYARELNSTSKPVRNVGKYISETPGKFFRPILVLFSAKMSGARIDKAVSVAVSVELIHAASLIHDDIIDESILRRHRSTLNSKWGNAVSVIAGDYLLARAFGVMSNLNEPRLFSDFSRTAGRMCEGEILQLSNAYNFEITEREYMGIIKRKSAYLISDCCAVGGILKRRQTDHLADYGLNLGMAFQIIDDCLDLSGDEDNLGKSVWQDMRKGKLTLPIIFLLKNSGRKNRKRIIELITLGGSPAHKALKEEAFYLGAVESSRKIAARHIELAKRRLSRANGPFKKAFFDIADYVLEREN